MSLKKDPSAIEILKHYRALVWPLIKVELKDPAYPYSFRIPGNYASERKYHWKAVADYPIRQGKYLRPTLTVLTAEAMGVNYKRALKTAAAMQMSEEWILVHDDFFDKSLKRRGEVTLPIKYGPEIAVNAGDTLHAIMWKLILSNQSSLGLNTTNKLVDEFHKIILRTMLGQTVEINWAEKNKANFDENDWNFIADSKSAYYSIAGPMRLGAILAGANKNQLELIAKFGLYLGRCFQLVDDLLDLTSDFGGRKEWANDIYEGKRTLILGHLIENASFRDKKKILAIMSKSRKQKTEEDVMFILERMTHYRSIIYAQEQAQIMKERAFKIFEKELTFLKREPARTRLIKLMEFVLERDH